MDETVDPSRPKAKETIFFFTPRKERRTGDEMDETSAEQSWVSRREADVLYKHDGTAFAEI